MRTFCIGLLPVLPALVMATGAGAAELVYEPFDYSAGAALTTRAGGSGWAGAWTQDGQSCVTGASGLSYSDAFGTALLVAGQRADTTGTATTRSFRTVSGGPLTNVWISFLYHLPASNSKFEGITFYRGTQALFSISNSSIDSSATITLGNSLTGGSRSTLKGAFGTTHFVALRLTKAGADTADLIEAFVDPLLSAPPVTADASTSGSNFDFDNIRIAGQDGSALFIDEFRVGATFADVAPHAPGPLDDNDGDGLTNGQEETLGLDPEVSDAALIAAIRSHPHYFGLYDTAGILAANRGGVVLPRSGAGPVNLTLEIQQTRDFIQWSGLQTLNRYVDLPEGANFLRVTIDHP